MAKLSSLRVHSNRLVKLPQDVSSACSLKVLDLHSNQLTSLPQELLARCYQ
jgi:Leucine-rich repeat (LRR) protein